MVKEKGLRVGKTPGAVAKDGGQSTTCYAEYTSIFNKNQAKKKEEAMKSGNFAQLALSFIISVCMMSAIAATLILLS